MPNTFRATSPDTAWRRFGASAALALGLLVGTSDPLRGQQPESALQEQPATADTPRHWWTAWSYRSAENRIIWAMWTLHINHVDDGWSNDAALALIWNGYYGATFETTHGPRGWTLGFERSWWADQWGPVGAMLGYRAGLVYGYDRRLGWMAQLYPILPFAQPVIYANIGPLAVDFTYTYVVVSFAAAIRF